MKTKGGNYYVYGTFIWNRIVNTNIDIYGDTPDSKYLNGTATIGCIVHSGNC